MNKILRWLISLTIASLISYALFAAVGQLIGTLRYDNPSNHRPAVSINFLPIYKNEYKETSGYSPSMPVPTQSLDNDMYKEQRYKSAPIDEKHKTETPPEPEPLSITKHTPANRGPSAINLQPIFRVEPIYPMYAITRGIEGGLA